MIFQIAWKNIWRNKKRSLILLFAICLGIWGGIFTNGVFIGMWETTIEAVINRELSHIQIHHPDFRNEKLVNQFIPNIRLVREKIRSNQFVKNFSERTILEGMISSPVSSSAIKILGIEPNDEKQITSIYNGIVEGSYFEEDKANQIVIGEKLADKLKVKLNSKVVLSFQSLDNNLTSGAFRVVGIFKSESLMFDASTCFVKREDLLPLLGAGDVIHEVAIRVTDINLIDSVRNQLRREMKDCVVEDWEELAPEFAMTRGILYLELNIFMGIILFALLFGISNTMMMSVFERIREFGVLLAIGMKRIKLFSLIILESIMLLFTGGLIGAFLGWITIELLSNRGIDLSIVEAGLTTYGMPPILYPQLPFHMFVSLFLMMFITAMLAAVSPAVKAVRLKPAEAIRSF